MIGNAKLFNVINFAAQQISERNANITAFVYKKKSFFHVCFLLTDHSKKRSYTVCKQRISSYSIRLKKATCI